MQADDQKILKGMWWIKGNEDKKFTGILTYGDGYVPTLEIFPKEYEFDKQLVPNGSTVYGDVFGESQKIQAVTLLECTSQNSFGSLDVGAFIYKQEFVYADCVAIGMLLDDDEIAQVQSPLNIYLTCPGLDEYSLAHTIDHIWKDNIPKGRAYRINDIDKIVYTQPEPITIEIDIGTITISLGPSGASRKLSTRYLIEINLENPTPQAEINSLIYSQLLSFLSIMTGRSQYIKRHSITISSNQTSSGSLNIELNYGHIAHSTQETKHNMLQSILIGSEENMRKFATLFPKWRENFAFVKDLAFHYLQMVEQPTETNILQAFPYIEEYSIDRCNGKGKTFDALKSVIESLTKAFYQNKIYCQHFPTDKTEHIAKQLSNFRNNNQHRKNTEESTFSTHKVYAYINVILRLIFLKEMEYSYEDIDSEIGHWTFWRQIDENKQ